MQGLGTPPLLLVGFWQGRDLPWSSICDMPANGMDWKAVSRHLAAPKAASSLLDTESPWHRTCTMPENLHCLHAVVVNLPMTADSQPSHCSTLLKPLRAGFLEFPWAKTLGMQGSPWSQTCQTSSDARARDPTSPACWLLARKGSSMIFHLRYACQWDGLESGQSASCSS